MFSFPFRVAKLAASKATKPTIYVSLIASLMWLAVDLADGASDRFHVRMGQAKTTVVEPADQVMTKVTDLATKLWDSIESNPGPSILALALFIVTVVYHKSKGATVLAAVKAATLKTTPEVDENPLLVKLRREALSKQMLETFDKLEARHKELPQELSTASADLSRKERELKIASEAAERARIAYSKAVSARDKLLAEETETIATMNQIEAEFGKSA